jgi:hypothetical protein
MDNGNPTLHADGHILGEIETPIVQGRRIRRVPVAGEPVFFEVSHRADERPIRVEDTQGELLGHLPRSLGQWLAKLLDNNRVRLTGYKPPRWFRQNGGRNPQLRIRIGVQLTPAGRSILQTQRPTTQPEALHQLVLAAFEQAGRYTQADLVRELADVLRPITCHGLLPETQLLLALLPGIAREIHHVEEMRRQLAPHGNDRPSSSGAAQFTQVSP